MQRSNLANQAMGLLSQIERSDPSTLHVALARINLDSGNLSHAQDALTKASQTQKPQGAVYAETEELWGTYYDKSGATASAIEHFTKAANADPLRTGSLRRLAELYAQDQAWGGTGRLPAGWRESRARDGSVNNLYQG
jgi:hypothetical protein